MRLQQNLLFDLDGTLTDPKEGITRSIAHALTQLGHRPPHIDELEWCIGPPLAESFAKLLGAKTHTPQAIEFYRERYKTVGMFENTPYPKITDILTELGLRGFTLYVCTSKPKAFADPILKHFAMDGHFKWIYGAELDGVRGDKADLIAYILERESLSAKSCLMIGDREHDVIAARKNGVPNVGVRWGYGSHEELTRAGAERILNSPEELLSLI